ncbi:MAG: hypothetical protein M1524_03760 [Patescibacteria group bacterium]|nr:hypothetical protein [Patescibacteria group bacterium]
MSNFKLIFAGYLVVIFGLFLYSFTQIDLGLTLSRLSMWLPLQKFFQSIGYFNRPLSTSIYLIILILLYLFYGIFLFLTSKNKIKNRSIWILILVTTGILTFSYNAFSYDLFNYIFDAKIITFYQQNPYIHKALDYPGDPMLSFMQWTHRTFPYGPTWLVLTVPLSFLGLQFFIPTFFLFKILVSASFIGAVYGISKILKKISPEDELFGIVFFGLNPLVIIECLVSSHNDIVMMFLILLSLYLFLNKKYFRSFLLFLFSVGVKFASAILIPVYILIYSYTRNKKEVPWLIVSIISILLMTVGIVFATIRTNFQPWYLLYVLPFAAFIGKKYYILIPTFIVTFFALLRYVPFLYTGNWNKPIPIILFWLTTGSLIFSTIMVFVWYLKSLGYKKSK